MLARKKRKKERQAPAAGKVAAPGPVSAPPVSAAPAPVSAAWTQYETEAGEIYFRINRIFADQNLLKILSEFRNIYY